MKALRECALAAGVLALVFLCFTPQPGGAAADEGFYRLADGSVPVFCGGAPGGKGHAPGPCHACRAQAAALPPPPLAAEPAFARITAVSYFALSSIPPRRAPHILKGPRAPPLAA